LSKVKVVLAVSVFFLLPTIIHAQQFDVGFGVDTISAPSTNVTSTFVGSTQSLTGGAYPIFSADYLLKRHFGIQGEVAWRAAQNLYLGFEPYRPIFFDFNAIYSRKINRYVAPELAAGIGAESVRFYQNYFNCSFFGGCTNYVTSTHFLGDVGGGLRLYVHGNFFVRPEAHLYWIHNNVEFSSNHATRYGISIGYTFGSPIGYP